MDKWTPEEDDKLKDAVQMHNGKNWFSIATLVPGRTKKECRDRWHGALNPSVDWTPGRKGEWTPDEDEKLKDAVQMQGGKNWEAIARLVPDRTKVQCRNRWHSALNPRIHRTTGRTGKWAPDEDAKLKDAAQMHNGKNWHAIARLVPGRTKIQCCKRWNKHLDPNRSTVKE
jgi:myb proto-oncogene protein